jgi:hypothetical protein
MRGIDDLKKEILSLAENSRNTMNNIREIDALDSKRKNIQRGKIIAYEHIISIIENHFNKQ